MGGSSTVPSTCLTWPNTCGQPGVYGTLGTPAAGNVPGGRFGAVSWTDSSGHLWLFGGLGHDASGAVWVSQRPLGVQPFHEPMGMDGRKQRGASVCVREGPVRRLWHVGNACHRKRPRRTRVCSGWIDAAAISGSLGALVTMPPAMAAVSTTFGSSILPRINGHGWAGAIPPALMASQEFMARWALPPPETFPEADI